MEQIRWGILGCGVIARTFAREVAAAPHAVVTAVGSRSIEKGRAFASEFGIPHAYGSYEELCASPEVDAIYVATPHGRHRDDTLLALRGGKHVLCEKAFAINRREGEEMIREAKARDLYLCEAMWTRWVPTNKAALRWIREGRIGEVTHVCGEYGFAMDLHTAAPRLYERECGGGALLDVGVYPIAFASMAFGGETPVSVHGVSVPLPNGVDGDTSISIQYAHGTASLCGSFLATYDSRAKVFGSRGSVSYDPWFLCPESVTLTADGKTETIKAEHRFSGHEYMIEGVSCDILAGKRESDELPLNETLTILSIMDAVRSDIGLEYPNDEND